MNGIKSVCGDGAFDLMDESCSGTGDVGENRLRSDYIPGRNCGVWL